jgi:fructosamine-3-kinase
MATINFCCLRFIEQKSRSKNYWEQLGQRLASLHRCSSEFFGLDHDNYIGSLQQYNHTNSNWINFFITQRLDVQVRLAIKRRAVDAGWEKKFEALYAKLPSIIAAEKPSLIHGDLWSGNLITDEKRRTLPDRPCCILW